MDKRKSNQGVKVSYSGLHNYNFQRYNQLQLKSDFFNPDNHETSLVDRMVSLSCAQMP